MMYLITRANGDETAHGPFREITLDGVTDDGVMILCDHPEFGTTRCFIRSGLRIVSAEELDSDIEKGEM